MADLKRTPLFPRYKEYKAKTIAFGEWELPVQFSGIKEEHNAVRENAGLFDVSHMGEIVVKGKDSLTFLQRVCTNDISKLEPNKAQYTVMCYPSGGVVDDFLVYMIKDNSYLLVVNAANTDKDFAWLKEQHASDESLSIENVSHEYIQLAIQGPKSNEILQSLTDVALDGIKPFLFKRYVDFKDIEANAIVSRTGYTGEDGFEIYLSPEKGVELWDLILANGKEHGLIPAGLGARDTLRLEAGLMLYGQDLSKDITPVEAGLNFVIKRHKKERFIGQTSIEEQLDNGSTYKLVAIKMIDKGIPREGYDVFSGDEKIGYITSGTHSITLKENIGIAYIKEKYHQEGMIIDIKVRKRLLKAVVTTLPFYKRNI